MQKVVIHTDGACKGNPGPGGWAAILKSGEHKREISGADAHTTNNRMELQAAIGAFSALTKPCAVTIYTDSNYLKDGITKWVASWKKRGWKTTQKQPVKNEDLWRQLDALTVSHQVTWKWLKGHAGHEENERCDLLANQAIEKMKSGKLPAVPLEPAPVTFETSTPKVLQAELLL